VGQEIVDRPGARRRQRRRAEGRAPWVAGATVKATVVAQGKHDKVRIFKMRRRKHYQKHGGHRQNYTELQIGTVNG
jgi:large subunit ribosomal protein L21